MISGLKRQKKKKRNILQSKNILYIYIGPKGCNRKPRYKKREAYFWKHIGKQTAYSCIHAWQKGWKIKEK